MEVSDARGGNELALVSGRRLGGLSGRSAKARTSLSRSAEDVRLTIQQNCRVGCPRLSAAVDENLVVIGASGRVATGRVNREATTLLRACVDAYAEVFICH
jgi:hypothetical protein